jgi:hypothetical protein
MNIEDYIRNKIIHDVDGEELENAISYYLDNKKGLNFGEFSLTGVNKSGTDGIIFPNKAIEATTQSSGVKQKFESDVKGVVNDNKYESLLFITTHPSKELKQKQKELEQEHDISIEIVGLEDLVDYTVKIQKRSSSTVNKKDAAFNLVFKRD